MRKIRFPPVQRAVLANSILTATLPIFKLHNIHCFEKRIVEWFVRQSIDPSFLNNNWKTWNMFSFGRLVTSFSKMRSTFTSSKVGSTSDSHTVPLMISFIRIYICCVRKCWYTYYEVMVSSFFSLWEHWYSPSWHTTTLSLSSYPSFFYNWNKPSYVLF